MSDSVFRTAIETNPTPQKKIDGKNEVASQSNEKDQLFATYEEDKGSTFTSDYFDIGDIAKEPEFKRDLSEIEGYLRQQVKDNKLDNNTKAVKSFLREMEKKAGLSTYETTNRRIHKLLAYIEFRRIVES